MADILAADIGATNSRFAHFAGSGQNDLRLVNSVWLPTAEAASFGELIAQARASDLGLAWEQAQAACFGVAGPVLGGAYCQPPWIAWDIDLARDRPAQGLGPCLLINDFVAQAWACLTPLAARARILLPGQAEEGATVAVIGAGSSLGHAALVPGPDGSYAPLASEFGHAAFAFAQGREQEYRRFLREHTGREQPTNDLVVSGKGLSHVHHFLSGDKLSAPEVGRAVDQDSETIRWMARFYGRACRQWALAVLALGGLYIAGGLALRLPAMVEHAEFSREFLLPASMPQVLDRIPVRLIQDEQSGLWGAAGAALHWLG